MNKISMAVFGLMLSVMVSPIVQAEVYRYRDAEGNLVFTDKPHHAAEKIIVKPDSRPVIAPPSEEEVAARAARCADFKEKLASYKKAVRLVGQGADGTKYEYTPQQRQRLIDDTALRVQDSCRES